MGNSETNVYRNRNRFAAALVLSPQSSNPIALGDSGYWADSSGVLQQTLTDGTTYAAARSWKEPVRCATAAVLPNTPTYASGVYTAGSNVVINTAGIDGITDLVVGDRILVKDQATATRNGIYKVTALGVAGGGGSPWTITRALDMDATNDLNSGTLVACSEGTVNADAIFELTSNNPLTLDSSNLTFTAAPLSITYGLIGDIVSVSLTASAPGVSTKVARADHGHLLDVAIAPTWSGVHNFQAGKLKVDNNSTTNAHLMASSATQARTATLPDADLTVAQAGVASAGPGTAIAGAGYVMWNGPVAETTAGAATLVTDVAITAVALTIAVQPRVPCKLNVIKTDADSSYAATLTIVGKGPAGEAIAGEVVSLLAVDGDHTYVTANAYSVITSATVSALSGETGADKIAIGQATAQGLPIPSGAGSVVVYKEATGATPAASPTPETVGTVDATARTVAPTTAADGTKAQHYWFSYTLASHTHVQT